MEQTQPAQDTAPEGDARLLHHLFGQLVSLIGSQLPLRAGGMGLRPDSLGAVVALVQVAQQAPYVCSLPSPGSSLTVGTAHRHDRQ